MHDEPVKPVLASRMDPFISNLDKISPLTDEAAADLAKVVIDKHFVKGDAILREGNICRQLYYLQDGLVKLFFDKDGKEFIMRFFAEGSFFTGLDSYLTQASSHYSIEALEATTVQSVTYSDLDHLCKKHHCIETAFRKFLSGASINMMNRISEMLEENGAQRYQNFIKTNGPLLQRITLGDLARYLGITQVSLSRIRAQK